jgi:hypothetical protein
MKTFIFALAAVAAGAVFAADARASGCNGPLCSPPPTTHSGGLFSRLFVKQPLPAFQAAPWYHYWPYNAHFMTPAPLTGAYYAPPPVGGMFANPYFPGHGGYPVAPHGYPHP